MTRGTNPLIRDSKTTAVDQNEAGAQPVVHPSITDASIKRILGKGCEGTVYLAEDPASGERLVVKTFFEPIQGTATGALHHYAKTVEANQLGLPIIQVIENCGEIIGIKYPYTPLYDIHRRIFENFDHVGQVLFSNYCRMQHYLISNCGLVLTDPWVPNFMMAGDGSFHYIDFGYSIRYINHPGILGSGQIGYSFCTLLADLYHVNIKKFMVLSDGYSHDDPCRYSQWEGLDAIAKKHPWLKEIILEVRNNSASIFQDAAFYLCLADRLPLRVKSARWIIGISESLNAAGRMRRMNRKN
jgi:hypothetical protein